MTAKTLAGKLSWYVALLCCCFLCGCGYRLAGTKNEASSGAGKSIAIPVFGNKSYRPTLETILTESLIQEFALRTGGKVVNEDEADLLLTGTVTAYSATPVSYTAGDTIKEYRADVTVEATILERKDRKVVWKGVLVESQIYPIDADIALQINREQAALREISRKLALRLYQKIGGDF